MTTNIIETMKQALEALTNPAMGYEEHFSAITSLRAAIDAAEKQEPVCYLREEWLHYEQSNDQDQHAFPVFQHLAPTQSDSEQAKIGCVGHDGECCKDREQVYLDAARYRWLRDSNCTGLAYVGGDCLAEELLDAAIDAAMKVGAGGVCHCAPLEK